MVSRALSAQGSSRSMAFNARLKTYSQDQGRGDLLLEAEDLLLACSKDARCLEAENFNH